MSTPIQILRKAAIISSLSIAMAFPTLAQTDEQKASITAQAIDICQTAAQNRYGDNSVKKVGSKAKWSNSLKGSAVKMKIKPKSKRATKYSCVVSLDKSVKFYKV